jgi:hypothetical protein
MAQNIGTLELAWKPDGVSYRVLGETGYPQAARTGRASCRRDFANGL